MQTFYNSEKYIGNSQIVFKKVFLTPKKIEKIEKFFTKEMKYYKWNFGVFDDSFFDAFFNKGYNKDVNRKHIYDLKIFSNTFGDSQINFIIHEKYGIQKKFLELLDFCNLCYIYFDNNEQMIFGEENSFIIKPIYLI